MDFDITPAMPYYGKEGYIIQSEIFACVSVVGYLVLLRHYVRKRFPTSMFYI